MTGENEKKWSPQQLAIFGWFLALVAGLGRNLVVRARAGTGKTATIIEAIRRLSAAAPQLLICLCAFNKRIAEELTARLGALPNACAKTLHSLGFACILPVWRGVKVDANRGRRLAEKACAAARGVLAVAADFPSYPDSYDNYGNLTSTPHEPVEARTAARGDQTPKAVLKAVAKLASLAKNTHPLDYAAPGVLLKLGADFEIFPTDPEECGNWTDEDIIDATVFAVRLATQQDGTVDFDDMLFVPLALNLVRAKFDVVVGDEVQDWNKAQHELARRLVRKPGSLVGVGDDRQAIYGFRGADCGSIDRLKAEFNAEELPLTVTYRCGKAIVARAKLLVPDFEAAEGNPEGIVSTLKADKLQGAVAPGNFVLSRKNAPLMALCLALLKAGTRAKIVGRDIGETLAALVRKCGKDGTVEGLLTGIDRWEDREVKNALRTDNENRAQEASDKADVLRVLAEEAETVAGVLARIDTLFADLVAGQPIKSVVLSSVHKAKGLEADKVFVLTDTLYPGKGGKDKQEEKNIDYVATTRAISELVLVAP